MTGMLEFGMLVAGGAVGAGLRYLADGAVMQGRRGVFPLGILLVNLSGSFVLALLTGLGAVIAPAWAAILGVGLLGGFTTFSTVSVESILLAEGGRRDWAWVNLVGTLVVCVVAAWIGVGIGGLAPR